MKYTIGQVEQQDIKRLKTDAESLKGDYAKGYVAGLEQALRSVKIVEDFYQIYTRALRQAQPTTDDEKAQIHDEIMNQQRNNMEGGRNDG